MPATSKSQQRLFSMALAVRKGDLPRSKVWKSVLDIVDSDMTDKEIEDFTVLKETKRYMKPLFDYINETVYTSKPRAEYIIKSLAEVMGVEITGTMKTIMSNNVFPDPDEIVELYVQTCKTPNGKKCNIYVWPNEWVTICDSKGGFVRFETKGYGKEYAIFDPEYKSEWKYQKDDRYIRHAIEWESVKNWSDIIKEFR